jgi:ActR/RegA family two-component response regulator
VRSGLAIPRGPLALEIPDSGLDLEALEKSLVLKALEKTEGNVSRAARLLGLSRRTLQYRLEKIQGAPDGASIVRKGAETT